MISGTGDWCLVEIGFIGMPSTLLDLVNLVERLLVGDNFLTVEEVPLLEIRTVIKYLWVNERSKGHIEKVSQIIQGHFRSKSMYTWL